MHEVNVRIYRTAYGGSDFEVQPKVLHLGGMWAAKVDQLRIELPEEWKGKALTLHIQRKSGALPTPLVVDNQDGTVAVTSAFTAEDSGLWMVMAIGLDGYKAMSRPAQYACYETINISGEEDIPQTMYEKFVAQVLDSANSAAASAKRAEKEADRAEKEADRAGKEADRSRGEADRAKREAERSQAEADESSGEADRASGEADRAKNEADRAAAIVSTDKTLSFDGAPADAKVTGDVTSWIHSMLITGQVQYHIATDQGGFICTSDGDGLVATKQLQFL